MEIVPLSLDMLLDVKSISDEQLGQDYITLTDFKNYHLDESSSVIVAIVESKIVGFSIYQKVSNTVFFKEHIKHFSSSIQTEEIIGSKQIGIINTVVVHEEYKKQGVASSLFAYSEQSLRKKRVDLISVFAWKSKTGINLEKIVLSFDFKRIEEFEKYWFIESLAENFNCADCGAPPCNCSAVLFTKQIKGQEDFN